MPTTKPDTKTALCDQHSIEYEFEDLEIEIDGLFVGSFWGKAELAMNDARHGDFYVKHIALKGRRREKTYRPWGLMVWRYNDSWEAIPRPADSAQTFKAYLFRAIEARIYEDEAARAAWQSELEDAA